MFELLDVLTPEEQEKLRQRELAERQREHEASVKRQKSRMIPMDRSNVVPKK